MPVPVAVRLGRRGGRRDAAGTRLDGGTRVSVHALRQQHRGLCQRGPDGPVRSGAPGIAPDLELSPQLRSEAGQRCMPPGSRRRRIAINVHGQTTFVWQSYPAIRSPYEGPNSLRARGQGRETVDATLYAGIRLWQGAEVWLNPEVDQGHGLAETHGVAGYLSGESYKLGFSYPYARMQRAFLRQTINLGGEAGKVDADINQFANTFTSNRLVMTRRQVRHCRHLRHQQICQQPQDRLSELGADQRRHLRLCGRRLGLHLRRRRRVVSGLVDPARRRVRPLGDTRRRRQPELVWP